MLILLSHQPLKVYKNKTEHPVLCSIFRGGSCLLIADRTLITSSLVGNFGSVKAWSADWPLASNIPDYRGHGKHMDALLGGRIHWGRGEPIHEGHGRPLRPQIESNLTSGTGASGTYSLQQPGWGSRSKHYHWDQDPPSWWGLCIWIYYGGKGKNEHFRITYNYIVLSPQTIKMVVISPRIIQTK